MLGIRIAVDDPGAPVTLLFCLPIALLAVTFGRRAGTLAGLAGITLVASWTWATGTELTALGWVTRAVPMLLLGVLLGTVESAQLIVSDLLRDAGARPSGR